MNHIKPYIIFESQVGEKEIKNINNYLTGMESSLPDKLFWIDDVDCDVIASARPK